LALPALIVIGLISLSKLRSKTIGAFFTTGIIIFSIFHGEPLRFSSTYSEQALQRWVSARQIIANTPGPKLISTPILAPIMGDSLLLDNGHTECYVGLEAPSRSLDALFPKRHSYFNAFNTYFNGIDNQIARKDFQLIVVTKDFHPMIPKSTLEANYFKLEVINLQTGGQTWLTEFWLPKK